MVTRWIEFQLCGEHCSKKKKNLYCETEVIIVSLIVILEHDTTYLNYEYHVVLNGASCS
jgi:hypothetical protein